MLLLLAACTPDPILIDSKAPVDSGTDSGETADTTESGDTTIDTGGPLGDPTLLCQVALTCPDGIQDEPKQPCTLRIDSGDGAPVYDAEAMVEIRGRSSASFPKPPYGLELHHRPVYLVPPHATWHYRDAATAPDGWSAPGFDDSAWPTGMAPLGYDDDQTTTIQNAGPAAFFRATFEVDDPAAIAELELGLVRDDGAIVWVNGHEVARSHLAAGADADDWADTTVSDEFESEWTTWNVDPALLVTGQNTIAVEVHQAQGSDDLRFDASLLGSAGRPTPDLFGMGGEDDWILSSAYIDRVLWRNKLAYDLFQSFGEDRWAAEQVFCELTKDGEYEGVYLLGESVRRDDDRLDLTADDGTGQSFIVKLAETGGFSANRVGIGEWQAVYPKQDEAHEDALLGVDAALQTWETALLSQDESQWDSVDLDSAVDWVILEELFKNSDAYYLSVHLWRDAGGPMRLTPWDFDLTLGYPYTDCGTTGWVWRNELPTGLAASPTFKARLAERWAELRQDPLRDEAIRARIEAYDTTMGDAITRNFERWPMEEIKFGWGDEDDWLCPQASWEVAHEEALTWLPERAAWLDRHISEY